jgi:predicted RNA methylase
MNCTELFNKIVSGEDTKACLQQLRKALKDLPVSDIPEAVTGGSEVFVGLLSDPDPKIRQNAAHILGLLKVKGTEEALYSSYLRDETLYNKAAYLSALSDLDHSALDKRLLARRAELIAGTYEPDMKKHIGEELHELSLLLKDSFPKHEFNASGLLNECVLLTNRNFKQVTMKQVEKIPHKEFTAGVMVKTGQPAKLLNAVRTFSEMLFVPDGIKTCSSDPVSAASELIGAGVADYIRARLTEPGSPVFFRVDYRARDEKAAAPFERRLSSELEAASGWSMINSTSDYEVELRFIDTADSKLVVLIRFCGLTDRRFAYRQHTLPVSIKPYLAALMMNLAKDRFKDNAAVLDPFCGCGTMLAEREFIRPARLYYGIDIFGDAVEAASANLKLAGIASKTELIKRDFFDFSHKYRFDEVITDMPFVTGQKSLADISALYAAFFKKLPSVLEQDGTAFIYTRNRDLLRKYSLAAGFFVNAEFEISRMEGSYFCILSRKQEHQQL